VRRAHSTLDAGARARAAWHRERSLDLDILLADGIASPLPWPAVPHPRVLDRPFAFVPGIEALERAELPVPIAWRAACARIAAPELAIVDESRLPRV
jgi:7,8-dihydro-6-hydroxymethylpterin-pyrophosphokinase